MISKERIFFLLKFWSIASVVAIIFSLIFSEKEIKLRKQNPIYEAYVFTHKGDKVIPAIVAREHIGVNSLKSFIEDFEKNPSFSMDTMLINPKTKILIYDFNADSTVVLLGYDNPFYVKLKPPDSRIRLGIARRIDVNIIKAY